jgi:hypothetical protein
MKDTFIAIVKDGKLVFTDYNRARFNEWLKDNDGHKIQIKRVSSKVSDNRRGWYFAGVLPFVKQLVPTWLELSNDQMHEVLKTEFNGFSIKDKHGRDRKYPMPVANRDVDSEQFDNYILRIAEWVRSNYALELPSPEEYKDLRDRGLL